MVYLLIIAILFASELVYFRIADRFNIIDKPNERSSHTRVTLRGGGVIYWVAALLYLLFNPSDTAGWFFAGITLMAGVSFWDDVKGLGQKVRLLFHLLASAPFTFLPNPREREGDGSSVGVSDLLRGAAGVLGIDYRALPYPRVVDFHYISSRAGRCIRF